METKKDLTCTTCGGNATVAVTKWEDKDGKQYIKKDERLCMSCFKKRTGKAFFK